MASAKPFGNVINVEEEGGGGGSSITAEVSRSGIQLDNVAMSLSVSFPPFNQREISDSNLYLGFESNQDYGSYSVDSEPDLHNCFIDFFDRESYEADTVGEFYISPNQRLSTSGDFNTWRFQDAEEDIELGLGIGSGSGSSQLRGELGLEATENREIDSGQIEVSTGLTPFGDDLFGEEAADEELEWEDLHNAINWVQEPIQEELSVSSRDDDQDQQWQVLYSVNDVGFLEETQDIMVDSLMDLNYAVYLDEYSENHGDYNAIFGQMFEDERGITGSPPASKIVVENLPDMKITSEEFNNGNIICTICKDEIVIEEKVKKLPCSHYYHGDCIIPWLGLRNTCPICRYELPTDDLNYERIRRSQNSSSS